MGMDAGLRKTLTALGPLARAVVETRTCKICGDRAPLFDVVDFNKICSRHDPYPYGRAGIDVKYFKCVDCNFLFTDFLDDWSHEDFSQFIYNDDYIKVDGDYLEVRPRKTAAMMADLLKGCESLRILDYGSGAGVFARCMADLGFGTVVAYDPFSHPVPPEGLFDLVTAFEVIEHSPRPVETFRAMTDFTNETGALIVGQTVQPANIEELKCAWWYTAPRNGHISTFSLLTLTTIARKIGLDNRSNPKGGLFGFARPSLRPDLAVVLDRIGPSHAVTLLKAPRQDSEPARWHAVETLPSGAQFRWSASDRLTWDRRLPAGRNRIEVPFVMEVDTGYAQRCRLVVQGAEAQTSIVDGRLVAELNVADPGGARPVELILPAPMTPESLGRAPDRRPLGLAVPLDSPDNEAAE